MNSKGREIHGQAAKLREEGKSIEALSLYSQALSAYQEDGDDLGFAEALADESIVLRHFYDKTGDKKWLILARNIGEASVEIAKSSGKKEALSIPLMQLANVYKMMEDYPKAVENFKEAVENYANGERPSYFSSMKYHLAYVEYKNGDKSAKQRLLNALNDLEGQDEVRYNKDVWLSGGYMSLAEMLRIDEPDEAKKYLEKAKEIIGSNPDLTLRKKQWDKLAREF